MLKKALIAVAVASAFTSNITIAEDAPAYESWLGGFAQHYNTHPKKTNPTGLFDKGTGIGIEYGYRFNPKWAARFEFSAQDIDVVGGPLAGSEESGNSYGLDAMYFLDKTSAYVFGGLRNQKLDDSYTAAAFGLGSHWDLSKNVKLITEAAAFYDLDENVNDYGFKLGLAYTFGESSRPASKPKDSDNDGVMDSVDRCPNTPLGQQVDNFGCNNDVDGDGVLNSNDQCPNTPAGTKVDAKGCAIKAVSDSDKDGVADDVDKCANTPMGDKVDASGCSVFLDVEVSTALNILFANNSSIIENPSDQKIVEFVDFLKRYGSTSVTIEGHSSSVGEASYNMFLSDRRAKSVVELLVTQYGIDRNRLTAVGYGETQLLDSSNTASAHRMNRRIEATVTAVSKQKATR